MRRRYKLGLGAACMAVIAAFIFAGISSVMFGSWDNRVADYYIKEGWKELMTTNVVTTIVWDFRGYDTLGEESVLFAAVIGILALGFGLHPKHKVYHKVE